MQAAEILESLRGAGPIGVLATIGIAGGTTASDWSDSFRPWVSRISIGALSLSILWLVLIFVHRLSGWQKLRYLETSRRTNH